MRTRGSTVLLAACLAWLSACHKDAQHAAGGDDGGTQAGSGAPLLDGGADASMPAADGGRSDAGSGSDAGGSSVPSDPNAPRGKVRGMLYGVDPADLADVRISAGGKQVTPSHTGYFLIDDALAGNATPVIARHAAYSLGYVRAPVVKDGMTNVILRIVPLKSQVLMTPAMKETFTGGAHDEVSFDLPSSALVTVYGTPAVGQVALGIGVLDVSVLPAGTVALDDAQPGAPAPFAALAALAVQASSLTSELHLGKAATVSLVIELLTTPPDPMSLYRFDESAGVFRKQGVVSYDMTTRVASFSVNDFGVYALGSMLAADGCSHVTITDASMAPVPQVAIHYWTEQQSFSVWADAQGIACLPATTQAGLLQLQAFGRGALGYVELAPTEVLPTASLAGQLPAGACGDSACAELGMQPGVTQLATCVRGTIAKGAKDTLVDVFVAEQGFDDQRLTQVSVGDGFCVDSAKPDSVTLAGFQLDCGKTRKFTSTEQASSTHCSEDDCLDLGTVTCCSVDDVCDDGIDEDCDGKIDEGCTCGGAACAQAHAGYLVPQGYCCAAGDACGIHLPDGSGCVKFFGAGIYSSSCMGISQDLDAGVPGWTGCCTIDMHCGLTDYSYGCIPRAELSSVYKNAMVLPDQGCTP